MKIVCLGNEFIEEDSFAKEVGVLLSGDFEVVNIRGSFELMGVVSSGEDFILLDVVLGLDEVRKIGVSELRVDSILSAHDFDVGYVLGLLEKDVKIIGIPMNGNAQKIVLTVKEEIEKL